MTGQMRVMDKVAGDFKVSWDKDDDASVENARNAFNDLVGGAQRFRAYRVESTSGKRTGEPVAEFDVAAEELLLVPPMAGG